MKSSLLYAFFSSAYSMACSIVMAWPCAQASAKASSPNVSRIPVISRSCFSRSAGGNGEPIASRKAAAAPHRRTQRASCASLLAREANDSRASAIPLWSPNSRAIVRLSSYRTRAPHSRPAPEPQVPELQDKPQRCSCLPISRYRHSSSQAEHAPCIVAFI